MTGPVARDEAWLRVEGTSDAGAVRRAATDLAAHLAFPELRTGELALVAIEIATNLVKHADGGTVLLRSLRDGEEVGVQVVAVDAGPGMLDAPASARDGVSSAGTLGLGLGAIARLSSSCDVHSVRGRGTVVAATLWCADAPPPRAGDDVAGITRPMSGEVECGDAVAVRRVDGCAVLLHVDGLGHGPLAARAAAQAVRVFEDAPPGPPAQLLGALHRGLAGTRGAAALVASVDRDAGRVRYAGVGNVSGFVVGGGSGVGAVGERRASLLSVPGIVGHQVRGVREREQALPQGAAVVLHSDGVRETWDVADVPGVLARGALVAAATVLRDAGGRRDDASVLVDLPPRPAGEGEG